jgi:hypothetical protein
MNEIAVALLSGGAADFVMCPIALLALFAAIAGCWSGATSAHTSAGVGAWRSRTGRCEGHYCW